MFGEWEYSISYGVSREEWEVLKMVWMDVVRVYVNGMCVVLLRMFVEVRGYYLNSWNV